jgi:glycosyltransferase involved in cell wall biosynthesis
MDYLGITRSGHAEINRKLYSILANSGHKVGLIFPKYLTFGKIRKKHEPIKTITNLVHYPLNMVFNNPRISLFIGLRKIIYAEKPKFIYTEFDPGSILLVYLRLICSSEIKIICLSCENLKIQPIENYKREGIKGYFLGGFKTICAQLSKKRIYHVQVLSNDGIEVFKSLNYKNISISHLGFDESIFKCDARIRNEYRLKLNLNKVTIAYFGRLVPEKGIHILIETLSNILDLEWQFLLDTFGLYETDYQNHVKNLLKSTKVEDRCIQFDANHLEIYQYMNAADITVVPSKTTKKWKEQFGRVAPEAMSCGNAIVVSSSGTLKEIISNNGFVFRENNTDSLELILRKLINENELLNEYKQKAIIRSGNYTLDKQVKQLLEIK